jgi:dephospho-CoA kinase
MRLERIVRDRGLQEGDAVDMIASQMPADLKRARADWVIENTGSLEDLEREVGHLWDKLVKDGAPSLSTSNIP